MWSIHININVKTCMHFRNIADHEYIYTLNWSLNPRCTIVFLISMLQTEAISFPASFHCSLRVFVLPFYTTNTNATCKGRNLNKSTDKVASKLETCARVCIQALYVISDGRDMQQFWHLWANAKLLVSLFDTMKISLHFFQRRKPFT